MFTHKASTVLTERGLDVGGLSEGVDEPHLAVKQRAGFHKVVYHLFSADLPVPVKKKAKRCKTPYVDRLPVSSVHKRLI